MSVDNTQSIINYLIALESSLLSSEKIFKSLLSLSSLLLLTLYFKIVKMADKWCISKVDLSLNVIAYYDLTLL